MPPRKASRSAAKATVATSCVIEAPASDAPDILRTGLVAMWREGTACDVELSVCDRTFSVHRVVLSATSEYFKALLCGEHFSEATASVIKSPT